MPGYRDTSQKQYKGQLAARGTASRGCLTCGLRFSLGGALAALAARSSFGGARIADRLVHPDLDMVLRQGPPPGPPPPAWRPRRPGSSTSSRSCTSSWPSLDSRCRRSASGASSLLLARMHDRISVRMLLSTRVSPGRHRNRLAGSPRASQRASTGFRALRF